MQASTITLLIGLAIGIALGFVIATLKSRAANANALGAQAQVKMLTEQLSAAQTQQNNTVRLDEVLSQWRIKPSGTEGYRTAEVTLGGIDCDELSSQTFEAKKVPGLYFVGEVIDVTGWLGGYNFQWAWSSAWAAGQVI
jgi:predicted flavoprotein YhiN